jgi:hypothetical protein
VLEGAAKRSRRRFDSDTVNSSADFTITIDGCVGDDSLILKPKRVALCGCLPIDLLQPKVVIHPGSFLGANQTAVGPGLPDSGPLPAAIICEIYMVQAVSPTKKGGNFLLAARICMSLYDIVRL